VVEESGYGRSTISPAPPGAQEGLALELLQRLPNPLRIDFHVKRVAVKLSHFHHGLRNACTLFLKRGSGIDSARGTMTVQAAYKYTPNTEGWAGASVEPSGDGLSATRSQVTREQAAL
jgi:hypothetical protein